MSSTTGLRDQHGMSGKELRGRSKVEKTLRLKLSYLRTNSLLIMELIKLKYVYLSLKYKNKRSYSSII